VVLGGLGKVFEKPVKKEEKVVSVVWESLKLV